MEPYCYFDGNVIPLADAHVRPDDLGILRGFAVYEGITALDGTPFHFEDHWNRLVQSAAALGLQIPQTRDQLLEGLKELLARNAPAGRASIRLIVSGGPGIGGIEYVPGNTLLYALAEPAATISSEWYTAGASLITDEHARFMPEYKTTGYITAVLLQDKRKSSGAAEILYTSDGLVRECSTSNIFIVKDGQVSTPASGILKGITRKVVIDLLKNTQTVVERDIWVEELWKADEIFITSSFKDIVPVVGIDGKAIGDGKPGVCTQEVMRQYQAELVRGD
jgi:branched-chain amino acid aminotransferase